MALLGFFARNQDFLIFLNFFAFFQVFCVCSHNVIFVNYRVYIEKLSAVTDFCAVRTECLA